ncbi:MAG: hypothetical protein HPY73_04160 [Methanomassiliicoccales archaeon]|nr:MAG: hypothetical protein HPY73_04160 [Methanomassiliicoccales archaeon]
MVVKRRPYDMIYLMTFEFAITVLLFYTAAVLLLMSFGTTDQELLDNLGSGPSEFLIDNARELTGLFGGIVALLTGISVLVIWGLLRRKRFSYKTGAVLAVLTVLVNAALLALFGLNDLQFALRLAMCIVLPFFVIYYLRRHDIADYLLH